MKCSSCKAEISDNASFCPNCGARVDSGWPQQTTPSPATATGFAGIGYVPVRIHSTYIYVVSLILMILGAIGWFMGVSTAADLSSTIDAYGSSMLPSQLALFNQMLSLVQSENIFILATFATTLVLMIFAVSIKRKSQLGVPLPDVMKLARIQFGAALIALAVAVGFVAFEAFAIGLSNDIAAALGIDAITSYNALIVPVAKVGLLIPCVTQALSALKTIPSIYKARNFG